jgi:hypothetical protein
MTRLFPLWKIANIMPDSYPDRLERLKLKIDQSLVNEIMAEESKKRGFDD